MAAVVVGAAERSERFPKMSIRDDVWGLWSAEGQIAALSASVVALADALGLSNAGTLDDALSDPDFDFNTVLLAHQTGQALPALLAALGVDGAEAEALHDPALSDTALMIVCQDSLSALALGVGDAVDALLTLTEVHQLDGAGLWLAQHLSAGLQAQMMLLATRDALPAQIPKTLRATAPLADALSLTVPDLPWTADRWPVGDQATSVQALSGLLGAFGVATTGIHSAAARCFDPAAERDGLHALHQEAATALDGLLSSLDQWSPERAGLNAHEAATEGTVALVQGALARAREVLEQAAGDPADASDEPTGD